MQINNKYEVKPLDRASSGHHMVLYVLYVSIRLHLAFSFSHSKWTCFSSLQSLVLCSFFVSIPPFPLPSFCLLFSAFVICKLINCDADYFVVGIESCLEPMKEQFHTELAQKLTPIDSILKENIGRMLRSKVS